jgi:hypothetical protein
MREIMHLRYPQKAANIVTALYKLETMVCSVVVTEIFDTLSSEAKTYNPTLHASYF